MKTAHFSIALTVLISFVLAYFSIYIFNDYGWLVFIFLPLFIGFLPGYLVGRKSQIPSRRYRGLAFTTLTFALFLLLVLALEGAICIAMALPIFLLLTLLGAYLAYWCQNRSRKLSGKNAAVVISLVAMSLLSFDYAAEYNDLLSVRT